MSYSHNKRKKNGAKFADLMCNTCDEFCIKRNRPAPMFLSEKEYNEEMYLWLNYKKFYKMDMTLKERAWVAKHAEEVMANEEN